MEETCLQINNWLYLINLQHVSLNKQIRQICELNPQSLGLVIVILTSFIQYNERERYQRLSLYKGIRLDVIDLESI